MDFQADKGTVIHDIDDRAGNSAADGVALYNVFPRALGLLFETERNLFVFLVHTDDHTFDFLIQFD